MGILKLGGGDLFCPQVDRVRQPGRLAWPRPSLTLIHTQSARILRSSSHPINAPCNKGIAENKQDAMPNQVLVVHGIAHQVLTTKSRAQTRWPRSAKFCMHCSQ